MTKEAEKNEGVNKASARWRGLVKRVLNGVPPVAVQSLRSCLSGYYAASGSRLGCEEAVCLS